MPAHLYDTDAQQLRALFQSGDWANYQLARTIAESLHHPIEGLFQDWERSVLWAEVIDETRKWLYEYLIKRWREGNWSIEDPEVRLPRYWMLFEPMHIKRLYLAGTLFDLTNEARIQRVENLEIAWLDDAPLAEFDAGAVSFAVGGLRLAAGSKTIRMLNPSDHLAGSLQWFRVYAREVLLPPSFARLQKLWSIELDVKVSLEPMILGVYSVQFPYLQRLLLRIPNLSNPAHRLYALEHLTQMELDAELEPSLTDDDFPLLPKYLRKLVLKNFVQISRLPATVRRLPLLETLYLENCPKLRELPRRVDFPNLRSLNLVQIGLSPENALDEVRAEFGDIWLRWS